MNIYPVIHALIHKILIEHSLYAKQHSRCQSSNDNQQKSLPSQSEQTCWHAHFSGSAGCPPGDATVTAKCLWCLKFSIGSHTHRDCPLLSLQWMRMSVSTQVYHECHQAFWFCLGDRRKTNACSLHWVRLSIFLCLLRAIFRSLSTF